MKYPIAIEPSNQNHVYGVVVPDLPGCFSAGETIDSAHGNAKEAITGWIELELDEGHSIPLPSSVENLAKQDNFKGWILGIVEIPEELFPTKRKE